MGMRRSYDTFQVLCMWYLGSEAIGTPNPCVNKKNFVSDGRTFNIHTISVIVRALLVCGRDQENALVSVQ